MPFPHRYGTYFLVFVDLQSKHRYMYNMFILYIIFSNLSTLFMFPQDIQNSFNMPMLHFDTCQRTVRTG